MARPKQALILRDKVLETALDLIDRDGVESFSMRILASALGVNAASLYHHFEDKDEILDGVARLALDSYQPVKIDHKLGPAEQIVTLVIGAFQALTDHPNIVPLMVRRSDRNFAIVVHERVASLLAEMGIAEELIVPLLDTLEGLLVGTTLLQVNSPAAVDYSVDEETFPILYQAIRTNSLEPTLRLEIGVRALLRGWMAGAALMKERA